jgi:hypothetical protein
MAARSMRDHSTNVQNAVAVAAAYGCGQSAGSDGPAIAAEEFTKHLLA